MDGSFVLRSVLLLGSLAALWIGLLWGILAGSVALLFLLLVHDFASFQQIVFSILALGLASAFGGAWLRGGCAVFTALWIAFVVLQIEDPQDQRVLSVFLIAIAVVVYAVGYGVRILHRRSTESAERLRRLGGEQQRQRDMLVKELHETVARDVTQLSFVVEELDNPRVKQQVKTQVGSVLASLQGVFRTLRHGTRDSEVFQEEDLTLNDIVKSCVSDLEDAQIPVQAEMTGDFSDLSLRSAEYIRRILTECTMNILKYGSRSEEDPEAFCHFSLTREGDSLNMRVSNSVRRAVTVDQDAAPSFGIGLQSVQDYAVILGGTAEAGTDAQGHWHVVVRGLNLSS